MLNSFRQYPYVNYDSVQPPQPPPASPSTSRAKLETEGVSASTPSNEQNDALKSIRLSEEGKQIPIGNGGYSEKYYWTQTVREATVFVDISHPDIRGRDVKCDIKPRHLSLTVKGEELFSGELEDTVKVDESMWTLSAEGGRGSQVIITLDKARHTWWKHICMGDPEIDTSKVA